MSRVGGLTQGEKKTQVNSLELFEIVIIKVTGKNKRKLIQNVSEENIHKSIKKIDTKEMK